jgi:hypothetical protein
MSILASSQSDERQEHVSTRSEVVNPYPMRTQPNFFSTTCRVPDSPSVAIVKVEQLAQLKTLLGDGNAAIPLFTSTTTMTRSLKPQRLSVGRSAAVRTAGLYEFDRQKYGPLVIRRTDSAARRSCPISFLRNVGSIYSEPGVEIL